ncbi:MAG: hypothetical protein ACTSVV_08070 [Promethearchaeota archaeon]
MKKLKNFCIIINLTTFIFSIFLQGSQNFKTITMNLNEETYNFSFNYNSIIISIVSAIILIAVIGLNVLGSGLNSESVNILKKILLNYFIWALFSIYTYNIITSIQHLGNFLYWTLTILYSIAILNEIAGSNSSENY